MSNEQNEVRVQRSRSDHDLRPSTSDLRPPASGSPRHAAQSDVGRVRSNNEDRWFADQEAGLYLVADGMGGRMAGDLASRAVVEVLPAQLRKALGGNDEGRPTSRLPRVLGSPAGPSQAACRMAKPPIFDIRRSTFDLLLRRASSGCERPSPD